MTSMNNRVMMKSERTTMSIAEYLSEERFGNLNSQYAPVIRALRTALSEITLGDLVLLNHQEYIRGVRDPSGRRSYQLRTSQEMGVVVGEAVYDSDAIARITHPPDKAYISLLKGGIVIPMLKHVQRPQIYGYPFQVESDRAVIPTCEILHFGKMINPVADHTISDGRGNLFYPAPPGSGIRRTSLILGRQGIEEAFRTKFGNILGREDLEYVNALELLELEPPQDMKERRDKELRELRKKTLWEIISLARNGDTPQRHTAERLYSQALRTGLHQETELVKIGNSLRLDVAEYVEGLRAIRD